MLSAFTKYHELFWSRVDAHVFTSRDSLAIFRCIFGMMTLIFYTPYYGWIAQVPPAFFDPPILSLANLFSGFPIILLHFIDVAVVISLVFFTLGIRAKITGLITLILFLIGHSFQFSFGKIDHSILYPVLLGVMSFSGWGTRYALIPDREQNPENSRRAMSLFAVILCLGMLTAGAAKLYRWVDFDLSTSGILAWYYLAFFDIGRDYLLAGYFVQLPMWIYELMDYSAVIFELSIVAALLISRTSWRMWILAACIFHFSTAMILNIPYGVHTFVYLLFVDWQRISSKISIRVPQNFWIALVSGAGLLHLYLRIYGEGSAMLFLPKSNAHFALELYTYSTIWVLLMGLFTFELISEWKQKSERNRG